MDNTKYIKAWEYALRILSHRLRSRMELENKLIEKGFSVEICAKVIDDLIAIEYIDDLKFSVWWIESCVNTRPRGLFAIKQELLLKGVNEDIIENALLVKDMDIYSEIEMAKKVCSKYYSKNSNIAADTVRKKMLPKLRRRGFSWESIEEVLKNY